MPEKLPKPRLELISPKSDILNHRADEILPADIASAEVQWVIDQMLAIASGTQGDTTKRTMVGLSANQVGILKRIILVDVAGTGMGEEPDLRVYINPEIIYESPETEIGREGCFSTGNVCGIVERPSSITVRAFDRNGNTIAPEEHHGFTARIFKHETDHLDGKRFPDLITDDTQLHWVESGRFGEYRVHWMEWDTPCPRETWEEIKSPDS